MFTHKREFSKVLPETLKRFPNSFSSNKDELLLWELSRSPKHVQQAFDLFMTSVCFYSDNAPLSAHLVRGAVETSALVEGHAIRVLMVKHCPQFWRKHVADILGKSLAFSQLVPQDHPLFFRLLPIEPNHDFTNAWNVSTRYTLQNTPQSQRLLTDLSYGLSYECPLFILKRMRVNGVPAIKKLTSAEEWIGARRVLFDADVVDGGVQRLRLLLRIVCANKHMLLQRFVLVRARKFLALETNCRRWTWTTST